MTLLLAPYAGQNPADCWKMREAGRFQRGEYMSPRVSLPWYCVGSIDTQRSVTMHFAHVSVDDPSKIAFTPSERHGREDRQIRMKPGKYLRKFYAGEFSEDEITQYARKFAALNEKVDFQLADTADDIENVYLKGPRSCMSNSGSVRAYAGHGLAVAYITGKDGDPTARAVCWPEKSIFTTIYGDESRLLASLLRAGYRREGTALRDQAPGEAYGDVPRAPNFEGAKLTCEESDGGWVCPWFDFSPDQVDPRGDILVVSRTGEYTANSTEGTIGGRMCERCECSFSGDDYSVINEQVWCEDCYCNYSFYCENCEESGDCEDSVTVHGDPHDHHSHEQTWCSYCADSNATECDECDEKFREGTVETDSSTYCNKCAEGKLSCCEHCDTHVDSDETREVYPEGEAKYSETWCNYCAVNDSKDCKNCENRFEPDGDESRCEDCGPEDSDADDE